MTNTVTHHDSCYVLANICCGARYAGRPQGLHELCRALVQARGHTQPESQVIGHGHRLPKLRRMHACWHK